MLLWWACVHGGRGKAKVPTPAGCVLRGQWATPSRHHVRLCLHLEWLVLLVLLVWIVLAGKLRAWALSRVLLWLVAVRLRGMLWKRGEVSHSWLLGHGGAVRMMWGSGRQQPRLSSA